MKHNKGTRAAVVAATLLAAGLAAAGPASAATTHPTTRISADQLKAGIAKAVSHEVTVCSAGIAIHPMGGRPVGGTTTV